MNVILLGYRGSGKTSIGKKLANELWKDFVDTDDRVRQRFNGVPIAEIWETHGEPAFRQAEAQTVAELLQKPDQVIALGGGTLTHDDARRTIQQADNATRIYLRCDPDVLAQRIADDTTTSTERPALTDNADPADEVRQVLTQRDPVYRHTADIVFDVTHCSIEEAVRYLIAKL
ncbi:MAG: shikimate kinase [Phycisphaeraceae bacterium]